MFFFIAFLPWNDEDFNICWQILVMKLLLLLATFGGDECSKTAKVGGKYLDLTYWNLWTGLPKGPFNSDLRLLDRWLDKMKKTILPNGGENCDLPSLPCDFGDSGVL